VRKHVRILGWLQIILGIIDLLIGLSAFGLLSGIGVFSGMASGEVVPFGIMALLGAAAGTFMLIMALPNLICGIGLLRDWGGWVIVLAVVLGVINLAHPPFGSAIEIYTFWVAWKLYNSGGKAREV
jgi:hypothetical protein